MSDQGEQNNTLTHSAMDSYAGPDIAPFEPEDLGEHFDPDDRGRSEGTRVQTNLGVVHVTQGDSQCGIVRGIICGSGLLRTYTISAPI